MKIYRNLYEKHWKEFEEIFGLTLSHWFNIWHGLDVKGLHTEWGVPDNTTTEQFVKDKFGDKAVELMKELT